MTYVRVHDNVEGCALCGGPCVCEEGRAEVTQADVRRLQEIGVLVPVTEPLPPRSSSESCADQAASVEGLRRALEGLGNR